MKITLEVKGATNGLILTDEEGRSSVYKFERDGGSLENAQEVVHFLYDMMDTLDIIPSRYSRERVQVKVVHGDKYECNGEGCSICSDE